MPKAKDILIKLVAADDALTDAYMNASPALKGQITTCSLAIEAVIKAIVRERLHQRSGSISKLSQVLSDSTDDLNTIKARVESFKQAAQLAQNVLNTLTALLPLL